MIRLLFSIWSLAMCANGYTLHGYVAGIDTQTALQTRIATRDFNGKQALFPLSETGNFSLTDIKDGTILVSLESPILVLNWNYRLDIGDGTLSAHKVLVGHDVEDKGPAVGYPLVIDGYQRLDPVVPRPKFSAWNLFTTPTMLMSLAALVFVLVIPWVMSRVDPEVLEDIAKKRKG